MKDHEEMRKELEVEFNDPERLAAVYLEYYKNKDHSIVFLLPIITQTAGVPEATVDKACKIIEDKIGAEAFERFEEEALNGE